MKKKVLTIVFVAVLIALCIGILGILWYDAQEQKHVNTMTSIQEQNNNIWLDEETAIKFGDEINYSSLLNLFIKQDKLYKGTNIEIYLDEELIPEDAELSFDTIGIIHVYIKTSYHYEYKLIKKINTNIITEKTFNLNVIDDDSPVLVGVKDRTVTVGETFDILSGITATDNSGEILGVFYEGEFDLTKPGIYTVLIYTLDASSNRTEQEMKITVKAKNNNSNSNETVTSTFTTSKGFQGVVKNGVTYIDGYLIANKTYSLPSNYGTGLTNEFSSAFSSMQVAAKKDGINIYIVSGFRSYNTQKSLYNNYVNRDGKTAADTYSARPGHSEHQAGLAADLNTASSSAHFENTKEYAWLQENAYKYGFILRYVNGKTNETGYKYEPWHYRYVGVELATKLYNGGDWITMEDYFGITSQYK